MCTLSDEFGGMDTIVERKPLRQKTPVQQLPVSLVQALVSFKLGASRKLHLIL